MIERRTARLALQSAVENNPVAVLLGPRQCDRAWIVYPGKETYPVHEKVSVCPLSVLVGELG